MNKKPARRGPILFLVLFALFAGAGSALADVAAGNRAFEAGDYETARQQWQAAAREGNGEALTRLGLLYEQGLGVQPDAYAAFVLYRVAVLRGYGPAEQAGNRVAGRLSGADLTRGLAEAKRLDREKRYLPTLRAPDAPPSAAPGPATALRDVTPTPVTSSARVPPVFQINFSCNLSLRYQDKGSGGKRDLALFHPEAPPGDFVLGSYAQSVYDEAHGCAAVIHTEAERASGLFAAPQGWERVWRDKGTGSKMDGSIWRAVPPSNDYVCLGHVAQTGYEPPPVFNYRCVHRCLVRSVPPPRPLWTTGGTGAETRIRIYTIPLINSFVAVPSDTIPAEIQDLDPNADCR
jgi:hypothetical protein